MTTWQILNWPAVFVLIWATSLGAQQPPPKPAPPAKPPAREAPREAPRTAVAVIETDLACSITIDGEQTIELAANGSRTLSLKPGEHVVRAVSKEFPDVVWRRAIDVARDQRRAVVIELRPLVEAHKAAEEKRSAAEAERRRAAERADLPALLIKADMDAEITVNGGQPSSVKAGESIRVKVSVGQNRVEAKAPGTDLTWSTTINLDQPVQTLVDTKLLVVQEERRLEEESRARERKRQDALLARQRQREVELLPLLTAAAGTWVSTHTTQSDVEISDSRARTVQCRVTYTYNRRVTLELRGAELIGEYTDDYHWAPARGSRDACNRPLVGFGMFVNGQERSRSSVRIGVSVEALQVTFSPLEYARYPGITLAGTSSVDITLTTGQASQMIWPLEGVKLARGRPQRIVFTRP